MAVPSQGQVDVVLEDLFRSSYVEMASKQKPSNGRRDLNVAQRRRMHHRVCCLYVTAQSVAGRRAKYVLDQSGGVHDGSRQDALLASRCSLRMAATLLRSLTGCLLWMRSKTSSRGG